MPRFARSSLLYARAVRRALRDSSPRPHRLLVKPDRRPIFVFGCPRSGTTFLAGALGRLTGYVDLGEVAPLKAVIPELTGMEPAEAAPHVRRILRRVQRLALTGGLRPIEQTPESAFIGEALLSAYPEAVMLHLVRDGRDVVCSLRERGWLSAARAGHDDAGHAYGAATRFWVESERSQEFASVSDVRRPAWAWRRYVEAGLSLGEQATVVRYETLTASPADVATRLATLLEHPIDELTSVLATAHSDSIGRHRNELVAEELDDVEAEAAPLLARLGYA